VAAAPWRVLVVGDPFFRTADFRRGLSTLDGRVELSWLQLDSAVGTPPRTPSERGLREYAGSPAAVTEAVAGHEVLVVHGAPVSAETLATPGLRLVCCARGGPVNVDLAAATEYGIPVCGAPGKNATAVAELTIAFALALLRGVAPASRELGSGAWQPESAFDGRRYFGAEAASSVLGLVGMGQVGRQVAERALALGFTVLANDPYADPAAVAGVRPVGLVELLGRSDIVSLHARGAAPLLGAAEFAALRPGAYFINTAREQLVDETALLAALKSGAVGGAALDVIEPAAGRNPLLDLPQVLVTPHIAGATHETLTRGAAMAGAAIAAMLAGEVPPYLVNPEVGVR
jgi:D-3-phosphoglycerate dehydrogenase / 2-oxoglutarate reductase